MVAKVNLLRHIEFSFLRVILTLCVISLLLISHTQAVIFDTNVLAVGSTTGTINQINPSIEVDFSGNVYIVYQVFSSTTEYDIGFAKSVDGGLSFASASPINNTDRPTTGTIDYSNAGGTVSSTLIAHTAAGAESILIDDDDMNNFPDPNGDEALEGIIISINHGIADDFSYNDRTDNLLTGIGTTDIAEGWSSGSEVQVSWDSLTDPFGNGEISAFIYVGSWVIEQTVTATYDGTSDLWNLEFPNQGGLNEATTTGPTYSFPTTTTSPNSYSLRFSITTGSDAWGDADTISIPIAYTTIADLQYFPKVTVDDHENAHIIWADTVNRNYNLAVTDMVWDVYGRRTDHVGDAYTFFGRHHHKYISQLTSQVTSAGQHFYETHSAVEIRPDVALEKYNNINEVYVVYTDDGTANHVYFQNSVDEGQTFGTLSAARTAVDDGTRPGERNHPSIATKNRSDDNSRDIYVVWHEQAGSAHRIMYSKSADGGTSWNSDVNVDDTGAAVDYPQLAATDPDRNGSASLCCVWVDYRDGGPAIYSSFNSNEGGWNASVKVSSGSADNPNSPAVAMNPENGRIYICWADHRNGDGDIYFAESFDNGSTWGVDRNDDGVIDGDEVGVDIRVNDDTGNTQQDSPSIAVDRSDNVYVTWEDGRDGYFNIYTSHLGVGAGRSGGSRPEPPTNLTARGGNGVVTLDWDATSSGVSYYNVYQSTQRGIWSTTPINSDTIAPDLDITDTTYNDTQVTNNTAYWYVVTAVGDDGTESDYSNDARATPTAGSDTTPPSPPTNLTARPANTEVSLSWTAPSESDVASYKVYRSTRSGGAYRYVGTAAAATGTVGTTGTADEKNSNQSNNQYVVSVTAAAPTSYKDTGLTNGVTYYYVVTALDAVPNESDDSNEAAATPTSGTGGGGTPPPASSPPSGPETAGSSRASCFIATAAYGTPMAEEVKILCQFRDEHLMRNQAGKSFVKLYYRLSPPLANYISKHDTLRKIVRIILKPIVYSTELFMSDGSWVRTITFSICILLLTPILIPVLRRKYYCRNITSTS